MYPYGYGAPVDAVAVVQEEMRAPQSRIPEVVRNFLVYFHRQMVDKVRKKGGEEIAFVV